VDEYWTFLDHYVDQLGQQGGAANPNAGKLKWGLDWLPAEEVRQLRLTRGVEDRGGVLAAAAKEAETAFQRAKLAEAALQKAKDARAKGQPADLVGAQNQLDAANAVLAEAQKKVQAAGAGLNFKKPRWLSEFAPVLPTPQPVGVH
jgi:hypothetical protein